MQAHCSALKTKIGRASQPTAVTDLVAHSQSREGQHRVAVGLRCLKAAAGHTAQSTGYTQYRAQGTQSTEHTQHASMYSRVV